MTCNYGEYWHAFELFGTAAASLSPTVYVCTRCGHRISVFR